MTKLVKGTETDKWLPPPWRKTTIPVLSPPAEGPKDIRGAAFLLMFNKIPFLVSAKHVIEKAGPSIAVPLGTKEIRVIRNITSLSLGFAWENCPDKVDLCATRFPTALLRLKLDVKIVKEEHWASTTISKPGDRIAHLGYPEKKYAKYADGAESTFPIAMPGEVLEVQKSSIIVKTDSAPGASGGPVFQATDDGPRLIGIAIEQILFGKRGHPEETQSTFKTRILPISLIKGILK
jgi:hypothetical protein